MAPSQSLTAAQPSRWVSQLIELVRGSARVRDAANIDPSTSLYDMQGLLVQGEELLARCRRLESGFSLIVFDCNDLPVVREIYGTAITRALIEKLSSSLIALAGPSRLAARTGKTQFTVAVPLSREKAMTEVVRLLGSPVRFELDSGDSEIVLVPNFVIGSVSEGGSVEKLLATLTNRLARLRDEELRRQSYLQRKRESYSRPAPLEAMADQPIAAMPESKPRRPQLSEPTRFRPVIPPTMPMPLAR
jgi:GGDEF domain-containing protein